MKQFSFKDYSVEDEDSYLSSQRSNKIQYSSNRNKKQNLNEVDSRIQEIKKKYNTSSRANHQNYRNKIQNQTLNLISKDMHQIKLNLPFTEKYQPRLQNIQRINSKIKQIFDQKKLKNQNSKTFININDKQDLSYNQPIKKQEVQGKQNIKKTLFDSNGKENSKSKRYLDSVKNQLKMCTINSNSKEMLFEDKKQYEILKNKQSTQNKKNRNIDSQIQKISTKIKQFQEEKRKLNIEFRPYNFHERSTENKRTNSFDKKQCINAIVEQTKQNQTLNKERSTTILNRERLITTLKHSQMQKPPLPKRNLYKTPQSNEKFILNHQQKYNISQFRLKTNKIQDKTNLQGYLENSEHKDRQIHKMIDGIEERKKRLKSSSSEVSSGSSNEIKILVKLLATQVELDEKVRNGKLWVECCRDVNKWSKLCQQLGELKIIKDKIEVEKQFTPSIEENNPFFTIQNCEQTFTSVAQNYKASKLHWQNNIMGKFQKNKLTKQNFYNKYIDLQKKQYFVLQDLVRFLNMETGTFFRNRDLYVIFKRLTDSQSGDFNTLVKVLCH